MTFDEYNDKINNFLSNTDNLEQLDEIRNNLKTDLEAFSSLQEQNKLLNDKIADLRDMNLKLYLKDGQKPGEDNEEKAPEETETLEDTFKKTFGHLFN